MELYNKGCFKRNKEFAYSVHNEHTIKEIGRFAVLWAGFEAGYFDKRFLLNKMSDLDKFYDAIQRIKEKTGIENILSNFNAMLQRRRHTLRMNTSKYISGLRLSKFLIELFGNIITRFMEGVLDNLGEQIIAAVVICFRIRNNMFHGEKDEVEMDRILFEGLNAFMLGIM